MIAGSLLAACVFGGISAEAQVRVNSSPNFVGSGARALGMGGAFIAVADDATAASWNPGGLTQLERPELSVVYSWKWFGEELGSTRYVYPDGGDDVSFNELNYLSFAYPLPWTIAGRNLVLSLNYQRKYDMSRELHFRYQAAPAMSYSTIFGSTFTNMSADVDYEQRGGLATISPAFGFEVTEKLSLGFVANIWNSSLVPGNEWENTTDNLVSGRVFRGGFGGTNRMRSMWTQQKFDDIEGINYTFGGLYRATERLTVGAVYHTAYSTDIDYTMYSRRPVTWLQPDVYRSRIRIDWPAVMGVGVAYRFPGDKLTVSMDVTRRNWDRYVQIDPRAGIFGSRIVPSTGLPKWQCPMDALYTVRLGAEYVFVDPKRAKQDYLPSIRAGLFYDPEPASGREDAWWGVRSGDSKVDRYYGFTLGAGVLIRNRVNIDLAYEYRFGNDVRRDTLVNGGQRRALFRAADSDFDEDVDQHLLYLSTVIYF